MVWELVVFVGLFIGSVTDLVRKEVPDMLNYSLIAIGVILAIYNSYYYYSLNPLITSALGFGVAFLISMLLFKTGQWGGGDAKMLWGIGTLSGFHLSELPFPFLLKFLVYSMLVGAVYGLLFMVYLAIKNKEEFKEEFIKRKNSKTFKKIRLTYLIASLILIITLTVLNPAFEIIITSLLLVFLIMSSMYLYLFMKSVEAKCFAKEILVKDLVPGDWVTSRPIINGKAFECETIGVTEEQIKYLKENNIKKVMTTEGIALVPAFLIAFLLI
jgi:Flp pilus assembly protein protease CpaA